MTENTRETGVRIPKEDHRESEIDQRAAENKRPKEGGGLSQPLDQTNDKTRQSDKAGAMENSPQFNARGASAKIQHGGEKD